MQMLRTLLVVALLSSLTASPGVLLAQFGGGDDPELEAMLGLSLTELMDQPVFLASGVEETLADAPAAMIVVTAEEIARRGYSDLSRVLADLPGFDVVVANGTTHANAYRRGYRTPFTQRTLLMIDGKVDNHLWSHMAQLSRQYPMSDVVRIEVLYGPASAVYGVNAFLGIVNVVTWADDTAEGDRPGIAVERPGGQLGDGRSRRRGAGLRLSSHLLKLAILVGE